MKAVTLYRPNVLENALSGFDRYMDSFFGDNFLSPADRIFNHFPPVDVRETETAYIIDADLPGFEEKDIEIRLDGNTLSIMSKKAEEKNEEGEGKTGKGSEGMKNYLIHERRAPSFNRSFKLPENADSGNITASFRYGILSLAIEKKAEAQARVIQISKK